MTEPSGDGGSPAPQGGSSRRTRQWVVGGIVAAVVVVGAVIAVRASSDGGKPDGATATSGQSIVTTSPTPDASGTASPGASPSDGATTAAPEPAPEETWEPGPVEDALPLDDVATPATDVAVSLVKLEAVEGTALGPGQVAGPALRITLEVSNETAEAIALNAALVQLYCGPDRIPGDPLSGPGVSEFTGTLAAGSSATGVYVITCPVDLRDDVQITFGYVPAGAKVAFEGAAPRA